jgi:N-acetylneuraminate lyase
LVPELFVEVWQAGCAGDYQRARLVQDRINDLIRAVLQFPMMPALKTILTWSGIDCGPVVAPRRSLTSEEQQKLRTALTGAGYEPDGFLRRSSRTTA